MIKGVRLENFIDFKTMIKNIFLDENINGKLSAQRINLEKLTINLYKFITWDLYNDKLEVDKCFKYILELISIKETTND